MTAQSPTTLQQIGKYLDRRVRIGAVPRTPRIANQRLDGDVVLLISDTALSAEAARTLIHNVIVDEPLAMMVSGPAAKVLFDEMLDILNDGRSGRHIMTASSHEPALQGILEDFFFSVLPSEDRFDRWSGYVVLVSDFQSETARHAIRAFVR